MKEPEIKPSETSAGKLPSHVAIIMDGNGRWAKRRGLPRIMGHHAGVRAVERTVRAARDMGIKTLSLYAFSSENWKRPESEVSGLMRLFRIYIRSRVELLLKEKARIRFAGRLDDLPVDIREIIREGREKPNPRRACSWSSASITGADVKSSMPSTRPPLQARFSLWTKIRSGSTFIFRTSRIRT